MEKIETVASKDGNIKKMCYKLSSKILMAFAIQTNLIIKIL
jgi:hypothetical protein